MRRLAPGEAANLFGLALAHTRGAEEQARLECRLGEANQQAGEVVAAQKHLERGVAALEDLGTAPLAAHHRLSLGLCCWERSQYARAGEEYESARAALEAAGPSEDLAVAYTRLSGFHAFDRDGEPAQRLAERAMEIAEAIGSVEQRIAAGDCLGVALCHQGQLDEGAVELGRCAAEARARGLHSLEARIVIHQLSLLETYGRVSEARTHLERLESLPEDPWVSVVLPYYQGWVHFWAAELGAAVRAAQRCVDVAAGFGMTTQGGWGRGLLCIVATELGDLEAARHLLPRGDRPLQRQERLEQGWAALRFHLLARDRGAAEALATELAEVPWALAGTIIGDTVVEALLLTGRIEKASSLLDEIASHPRAAMHPGALLRACGRLALARGDAAGALGPLSAASDAFLRYGYRLEHLRTAGLRAEAEAAAGDLATARRTLDALLSEARAAGAAPLAGSAAEVAVRFGIDIEEAAPPSPVPVAALFAASDAGGVRVSEVRQVGERLVTVLSADVRGFTAMSPRRAPAEMSERIAALQRWAALTAERHHGFAEEFAGGGVMATFNATGRHVDHTRHALEAGLELRADTARLGLELGMAIASGPAIVGQLTEGGKLTVLGPTANLAAQLEPHAGGGEMLMSEEAFVRVRDALPGGVVDFEERVLDLKGFGEPVRAVRLSLGDRAASPGAAMSAAEGAQGAAGEARPRPPGEPQRTAGPMEEPPSTFVLEGEFWSVGFTGTVVRLKDAKGLRDLARLLASPRD